MPEARYFSMPSREVGADGRRKRARELEPMSPIVRPVPAGRDPIARSDARRMADDRHQVPVPAGLHAQHAEPVLLIVEGDAFDETGQDFSVGRWNVGSHEFKCSASRERLRHASHDPRARPCLTSSHERATIDDCARECARQILDVRAMLRKVPQPRTLPDVQLIHKSFHRHGYIHEKTYEGVVVSPNRTTPTGGPHPAEVRVPPLK